MKLKAFILHVSFIGLMVTLSNPSAAYSQLYTSSTIPKTWQLLLNYTSETQNGAIYLEIDTDSKPARIVHAHMLEEISKNHSKEPVYKPYKNFNLDRLSSGVVICERGSHKVLTLSGETLDPYNGGTIFMTILTSAGISSNYDSHSKVRFTVELKDNKLSSYIQSGMKISQFTRMHFVSNKLAFITTGLKTVQFFYGSNELHNFHISLLD